MAVSTSVRTCYIVAPANSNLKTLTEALRQRDIRIVVPERHPEGQSSAMTSILADTDLVIGVMTRERRSDWVLFDLGQAWGMGKRILLFAPPNASFLPSYLQRFLTVRANLSNREAIAFALDQLLAAPASSFAQERVPTAARILGPAADRYLQGSYQLGTSSPLELERLVENALREGGVDVVSTAPGREQGVDLAIWSDALQASVGNPLLVEIRSRLREPSLASEAVRQLSQQVAASGSYWGLLLYGDGEQTTLRGSLPPNVLLLSLKTLFERMRHEPFDDIIRDLRNRRVHGGSI